MLHEGVEMAVIVREFRMTYLSEMRIGAHALGLWIGDHDFYTRQNLIIKNKTTT